MISITPIDMAKKKKKPVEDGIEFDSQEEIQFYYWLSELKSAGFVKNFKKVTDNIEICPKFSSVVKKLNGKIGETTIFRPLTYTPDFEIIWSDKSVGIFITNGFDEGKIHVNSLMKSIIDVKGKFAGVYNNSALTFPIVQKVLHNYMNVFVQKVIPENLFEVTFLPRKLFKTKTGKEKTWKFAKIPLEDYLKNAD